MNQLSGKYVNVVLSVEDGRGMEFVRHPIHVTANYNGRILESDHVMVENRAAFNTELIWEAEKKDLRKMRSSNQPLRVECVCTDPQNRRDRIGFVLLSLRSAQIIPLKDAKCSVIFKWYKLIGCQADKKKHHPELYLALTIRDHLLNSDEIPALNKNEPLICEEVEVVVPNVKDEDVEFISDYPLKYLDDGYIKVGDDDDYESFTLNLLVREAKNLDTLLPEEIVFRQNTEKFHMTFKLFGVIIKTKPFYKHFHDVLSLNEKVVVRILANEDTLFNFFESQKIHITLFSGHEILGSTDVDLGSATFEEQSAKYFFKLPLPNNIVPFGGDEVSPFLEIQTWIKRSTDSIRYKPIIIEEKTPAKVFKSNLEKPLIVAGCGDHQLETCILDKLEKVEAKAKSECNISSNAENNENIITTKSVDTVVKNVALSPRLSKKYDVTNTYVQYVIEVSLQNLVWRISPKERIVIFKFLHPRASNYITIFTQVSNEVGETSDLKNIGVKICYISTTSQIENILNAWPPKLVLTDEREKLLSEEYEFDASKFFCDGYKSYKYIADLKAIRTLQPLARLQVTLKLEGCELGGEIEQITDFNLIPPIVDEIITVKELTNIEQWKKNEKEKFDQELERFKQKETERLEQLWKEKRRNLEQKLNIQVEKCQALQEDLKHKVDSVKTEKYLSKRRNQLENMFEEFVKENCEKYSTSSVPQDVIEELSRTQSDNECLRQLIDEQRKELQLLEKTTFTKEQSVNLLQELKCLEIGFMEAQQASQQFKMQWQNNNNGCDKEIIHHDLKIDDDADEECISDRNIKLEDELKKSDEEKLSPSNNST